MEHTREQLHSADSLVERAILKAVMTKAVTEPLVREAYWTAGLMGAASRIEPIQRTASRFPDQDIILVEA